MENAKTNEKKAGKGFFARRAEGAKNTLVKITMFDRVAETWEWIREGASKLDPRRYPLSEREKWMNPPKNDFTFEGVMYRNGVDEAELSRRHQALALSCYVAILGAGVSVGITVASYFGDGSALSMFAQTMACVGVTAALLASAARSSYQAFQIRRRDLNLHMRDWLAHPWEIVPPFDNERAS